MEKQRLYKQEKASGTLTVLATKEKFFVLESADMPENLRTFVPGTDGWVVTPVTGSGVKFDGEYRYVHPAPSVIYVPTGSYYVLAGDPIPVWVWTNDYIEPPDTEKEIIP